MANFTTPYATRLCLSGVESRRLLDTFKEFNVKHIQVSYYYLRRVFHDPLEFEQYTSSFETVILDSGTVYGNLKSEDEKKELLSDYASFLAALDKRSFTAAVFEDGHNLDKILPDEALIYPLDDIRGVFDNNLSDLFNSLKYVGVSNKEASAKGGENLAPIFAAAAKRGAYIHAFGTGSRKILSKYPFYSANSSSWRSGSRYLNTYIYEGPGRGLRLYQPTDKKDPIKTERETRSIRRRQSNLVKVRHPDIYPRIDWGEVYEGDSWEVDKGNLAQWLLYVQDLEDLAQNKYFLSEDNKRAIIERRRERFASLTSKAMDEGRVEKGSDPIETPTENDGIETGGIVEGDPDEENVIDSEVIEVSESRALDIPRPNNKGGRLREVDDRMRYTRNCDYCILADRCPKFQPGSPCAFGLPPEDPSYDPDNLETHILEDAADLLAIQKDRILQLYLEEKMDASGANKDLTNNLKLYMEMVQLLSEATDKRDEITMKAKGTGVLEMFTKRNNRGA